MSLPTPNYILVRDYEFYHKYSTHKKIPVGSFVRPINPEYLPAHLKETADYKFLQPKTETFAYCHYGIVLIPWHYIRRVS